MPVNEKIVNYKTDPHGKERIVTPGGDVVAASLASTQMKQLDLDMFLTLLLARMRETIEDDKEKEPPHLATQYW